MGPGLWLSSLPLHSSEVPERHLSDLNWKDGEMHSERNLDRGEIEEARHGAGEEGVNHVGADTLTLLLF